MPLPKEIAQTSHCTLFPQENAPQTLSGMGMGMNVADRIREEIEASGRSVLYAPVWPSLLAQEERYCEQFPDHPNPEPQKVV